MKKTVKKSAAKRTSPQKQKKGAPVRQKHSTKNAHGEALVVKEPVPKEKKLFISLIAIICVLSLSLLTHGSIYLVKHLVSTDVPPYASLYEKVDLKEYVSFGKEGYTGKAIDLTSLYVAPYTLDDMDDYLKELLLSEREEVALGVKTGVIGYGDDVECYLLYANVIGEDGKTAILPDAFAAADYSAAYITVGANSTIFGEAFDNALIAKGISPIDTYRALRLDGKLSGGEVIAISYRAYKAEVYNPEEPEKATWSSTVSASTAIDDSTLGQRRLDLAKMLSGEDEAQKRFAEAIIASCKEIEEPFEFILENYDSDGNGKEENAVKYLATVHFVAEEETTTVTFDVPENHFTEKDGATKEYIDLNGKTVELTMIFSTMNDYNVPSPTASFLKELDEDFKTDKTADADVLAEFKAYSLEKLNRAKEESLRASYYSEAYATLVSALYSQNVFGKKGAASTSEAYPEGAYDEAYARAYNEITSAYYSSGASASMQLYYYVIQYVYNATGAQYDDANAAIAAVAQQYVVYDLFMYYVFSAEKLSVSDELLKEKYDAYVESLIASYSASDSKTEYNEAYFVEKLGEDALFTEARRQAVYELVGEYLLEHNNVTYGS